jgi:hypothetical protein
MAGKAKVGLSFDEKVFFGRRVVRRMAVDAAYIVLPVKRVRAIQVSWPGSMTGEAASVDFLRGMFQEDKNLGLVTPTFDVSASGAVAAFATLMRYPFFGVQCCPPMRRICPGFVEILMTGLASVRTYVIGILNRCGSGCRWLIISEYNPGTQ